MMSDARGGYRRPRHPAPVSGPSKHSKRTDGGPGTTLKQAARYMQGNEYGESKELNDLASSADLAAAPGVQDAPRPQVSDGPRTPGLADPTQRPDEPVTAGMGQYAATPAIPPQNLLAVARAAYIARPSRATLLILEQLENQQEQ
jgi:hypothetical protein